ncbi:hypothetical protein QBC47DRAFT_46215 [Echria macrotheca]|uniref:DUF676 domain-containing protein n=1 Tax=Echria macrotheca TaxID=438768 RepID=A0AAJ0F9X6_9PEZI|nr:hypothetical protein QBC47DRAFT_46215 [Echria macrotheca]
MANQKEDYGIQEIWTPPNGVEPEVDIVAVHGLGGRAVGSWTSKQSNVCWLNHPNFLPKYIKNARVLVWGYNASLSSLVGEQPSKDRIHHHAQTLVANLAADRRLSGTAEKPIVFLCHSLGGIIVKRALSYAQTRTGHKVAHDYSIFTCTYAILFFGTPHNGSSKATWVNYMKKLGSSVTPRTLGMSKSDLVSALECESETLQNITDYFVPIMRNFRVFFFWEQEQTNFKVLGRDYIVAQDSAAPVHDDTERAGIAADHRGMVKFETPTSQGFRMVMDALSRYCEEAPLAIRQRHASAAHTLALERHREATEALGRSFQTSGGVYRPPFRAGSSGLESFTVVDRSGTFRSITGRGEENKGESPFPADKDRT